MLSPSPTVRSGVTTGSRFEKATTSAPVALTRRSVPGAWSGWVCVRSTQRTRSRIDAPTMASMCFFVSGPGSITATSSMPTRYVFVPGPVNGPGLGATIRRTSGDSALGTPGVRSGISSLSGAAPCRAGDARWANSKANGLAVRLGRPPERKPCGGDQTRKQQRLAPSYCRCGDSAFRRSLYAAVAVIHDPRRAVPSVERVVEQIDGLPAPLLVDCAREAVNAARAAAEAGRAVEFNAVVAEARAR